MSLFSILSGKRYHFNTLNGPIDNDLFKKIMHLDNSPERISLTACFWISQRMVLGMFHDEDGMFKDNIKSLTEHSLKMVWIILMLACIEQVVSTQGHESKYAQNLIEKVAYAFGEPHEKIKKIFSLCSSIDLDHSLLEVWRKICNLIGSNPRDEANFVAFATVFSDTYDTCMAAAREEFKQFLK